MSSLTGEPRRNRTYTPDEKEVFFAALARTGNMRQATDDSGISYSTGYQWAKKTGVETARFARERRETFAQLRRDGVHQAEAARRAGVHARTARDWDQGIRRSSNRRIYPDGRIIDYNSGVATAPSGIISTITALEAVIDARYLSLVERERIRDAAATGASIRSIAVMLARSPSTISREVRRNTTETGSYEPYAAHRVAAGRRPRPKESKLVVRVKLREFVREKLQIRWSPEQICQSLIMDYPDDQEMRVSPETIYQALYFQARGGLRKEVQAALRTGRTRRKPQNNGQERRSRFIDPMVMIADRPPEIEDRAVPGHWEGDLITGTLNQSAIGTLVERATRFVMLVHLPGGHTAEEVRDGLVATMATLPAHLRGSLTWDQGAEMATHKSFSVATGMPVYFCDPGSPWQRGTNENTNGLLRQYFPKSTDLSAYSPEDLERVALELNARPRKTLGWETPAERFRDLILST